MTQKGDPYIRNVQYYTISKTVVLNFISFFCTRLLKPPRFTKIAIYHLPVTANVRDFIVMECSLHQNVHKFAKIYFKFQHNEIFFARVQ